MTRRCAGTARAGLGADKSMNRVSWSVEEIEPSVREKAEAAAKRAGLSLTDWINAQLGEAAPQQPATEQLRMHSSFQV